MEYDFRYISPKRCQEIDDMKIPCPWAWKEYPRFFVMDRNGEKYFSSEDEKIIFTLAFVPVPADREFYEDYYLLIKENEYYLFNYQTVSNKSERIDNIIYADIVQEIQPNEKIDNCNEKDEVLKIISEMIKKSTVTHFNIVVCQTIIYGGKEI